jgi:hypothetical protein
MDVRNMQFIQNAHDCNEQRKKLTFLSVDDFLFGFLLLVVVAQERNTHKTVKENNVTKLFLTLSHVTGCRMQNACACHIDTNTEIWATNTQKSDRVKRLDGYIGTEEKNCLFVGCQAVIINIIYRQSLSNWRKNCGFYVGFLSGRIGKQVVCVIFFFDFFKQLTISHQLKRVYGAQKHYMHYTRKL